MTIRLIMSDLDGTLLRDDKTVSARTRTTLQAARAAGVRVGIATARPARLALAAVGHLRDVLDVMVVSNGAVVLDAATGAALHEDLLDPAEATRVISSLRGVFPDAGFGWELGDHFEGDAAFNEIAQDPRVLRDTDMGAAREFPADGVHQLVLARHNTNPLGLVAPVADVLGPDYAVSESGGGVVEISPATSTKAAAVTWYAESFGASQANVLAFGDGLNDVPMIRAAGIGVAMASASAAIKASADRIAPTNMDDGVARTIEELVPGVRGE
ncbi:HAD-IIB family hydrolase [Neoactinobaculum massilliense]|uniref:HAD-IIB family hydrolase n=1 Tax=Neoactinobaculum massilliense TaxID=2364794 RepID=UPI000F52638F|nr:HAD-IIB family hydrolase [Neoactinobaculum massilliense]